MVAMSLDDLGKRMAARHAGDGMPAPQTTYTSYDQVPVHRKRWFFVLMVLVLTPVGIVLAVTGDLYMFKDGQVMAYSKQQRLTIAAVWTALVVLNIIRATQ